MLLPSFLPSREITERTRAHGALSCLRLGKAPQAFAALAADRCVHGRRKQSKIDIHRLEGARLRDAACPLTIPRLRCRQAFSLPCFAEEMPTGDVSQERADRRR